MTPNEKIAHDRAFAEIEFNEAYERVCHEARDEFDKRAAEMESE